MKLLIADDHEMFKDALSVFFEQENGIDADFACDLHTAIDVFKRKGPFDLVLLDYCMPGMNGLEGLKEFLEISKDVKIVIISGVAPTDIVKQAMTMGASGFLPKTLSARTMVNALHFMYSGEIYLPFELLIDTSNFLSEREGLSRSEQNVLKSLSLGKTNKEIANDLQMTDAGVKSELKRIFRKIGVRNRTEAALYAKEYILY